MKHICLDIGNVLCDVDFSDFLKELEAVGIDREEAWFFLNRIQALQDLGHTTMQAELRWAYKFSTTQRHRIMDAWMSSIQSNPISLKYFDEFCDADRGRNFVAILSNIGHEHNSIIADKIGINFKNCVRYMSCDIGARKPSVLYYKSFMDEYPEFDNAIYVDDRPENLEAANCYTLHPHKLDTQVTKDQALEDFWNNIRDYVLCKGMYIP